MEGHQIQDNILVAHEIFHFLKLRKVKTRFELAMKIDMNNAYDRIKWDFLEAVMVGMGFNRWWIKVVMGCVIIVDFSVLINGQPGKWFKPSCGLRQGDPLSLYLFLIVTDVFSRLIQGAVDGGFLEGIRLSMNGPTLSHLLFADDTLIFL